MTEHRRSTRRSRRHTKDKVLQARIPEDLDTELRGRAEQLGLSVSTVVRNVLLHTFDLVEGVVADSAQLARAIQGGQTTEANRSQATAPPTELLQQGTAVLGWQELVLNRNGICDQCNAILPRGKRAAIGVPVSPRPVLICQDCLATLSATAEEGPVGEEPSAGVKPSAGENKQSATAKRRSASKRSPAAPAKSSTKAAPRAAKPAPDKTSSQARRKTTRSAPAKQSK